MLIRWRCTKYWALKIPQRQYVLGLGERFKENRGDSPTQAALLSSAQIAAHPTVCFGVAHRVGLAAIGAAQNPLMLTLRQHESHGLLAFGAGRR